MRASRLLWVIVAFSNLLAVTKSTFGQGALSPTASIGSASTATNPWTNF